MEWIHTIRRIFIGSNTTYSWVKTLFLCHREEISTVSRGQLMDTFKTMVFELKGFHIAQIPTSPSLQNSSP